MTTSKGTLKALIPQEVIQNKILLLRGKKIMFDRDLAKLYGVETEHLKRQVRRNLDRFPDDFLLILSKEEVMLANGTNRDYSEPVVPEIFYLPAGRQVGDPVRCLCGLDARLKHSGMTKSCFVALLRLYKLDPPFWRLRKRRSFKVSALCFHRTWGFDAIKCVE